MNKIPVVYIMTNKKNGTLYTGVTSNLPRRIHQHKYGTHKRSFTRKYGCNLLVYYEQCPSMINAIKREKAIKAGRRYEKLILINNMNPDWRNLFDDINT